jgi:mannosyl-oligosaccharide alpha-1,2-mannosidase
LDLSEKDKKRHMWAAKGLAYTCYISYADQASGLGPDVLQVVNGAKWVDVLDEWENGGMVPEAEVEEHNMISGGEEKRGGGEEIPPGLGEPPSEVSTSRFPSQDWAEKRARRDYTNAASGYLLRPEVSQSVVPRDQIQKKKN